MIETIEAFCRFMFNTDPKAIVCRTYGISDLARHKEYIAEKMKAVSTNPLVWFGTLDSSSRLRLAKAVEMYNS